MRYLVSVKGRHQKTGSAVAAAILVIYAFSQQALVANSSSLPTSAPSGSAAKAPKAGNLIEELRNDFIYLFSQKDFYQVIGGVGVVPLVFDAHFRRESPEFTEKWGTSVFADNFFELGEGMGSAVFPLLAGMVALSMREGSKNHSLSRFGSDMIRSHFFNGLITVSLKKLVNRTRPDGAPFSYPSGHSSTAFASAGVIYYHCGPKLGLPAFAAATYVGLSRLQENKHYMSDIIAGAIIGTYISFKISGRTDHKKGLDLRPVLIDGSPGANIALQF